MRSMRNTADLVNEMIREAKTAYLAAIAVGFETDTKFVFSSDRQPLAELNRLVKEGGSPVGLLRFEREDAGVQGSYRPFEEYADQDWAGKYLAGLLDHADEIIGMSRKASASVPNAY